jgi:hypothetical protein
MFASFMAGVAKGVTDTPWLILIGGFNGPFFKCREEKDTRESIIG